MARKFVVLFALVGSLMALSASAAEDRQFSCTGVAGRDWVIYLDLDHKLAAFSDGKELTLAGLRSIGFAGPYSAETIVTYDNAELQIVFNKTKRSAYVVLDTRSGDLGLEALDGCRPDPSVRL